MEHKVEGESHGLVPWTLPHGVAALLASVILIATSVGCDSNRKTHAQTSTGAHIDIDARAARLLQGRRLALSLGTSQIRDIWVLSHGRLVQVSKSARVAIGGTSCFGSAYGPDGGPCYQWAEPFSLSPDGDRLAFVLGYPFEGASDLADALVVSRSDGSHARRITRLDSCVLCRVSTPSWDKDSRSFVLAVESYPTGDIVDGSESKIYRVTAGSGRATMLSAAGTRTYSEGEPVVSPDGRRIAFLRSVKRWPSKGSPAKFVYVMSAHGATGMPLPLPRRRYVDLWWCGSSALLCVDSPIGQQEARGNVYRVDLHSGQVTNLKHWAGASYSALSPDGTFAVRPRKTGHRWQLLVGPVDDTGAARLRPLLTAKAKRNPYYELSVSER